jgi:hypothetical protein
LVSGEFGIYGGELDIDRGDSVVDLETVSMEIQWKDHSTFAMAELRVGFGAELFAPKSRFILEDDF